MNTIEINQAASRIAEAYRIGTSATETTNKLAESIAENLKCWLGGDRAIDLLNYLAAALQEQADEI